MTGKLYYLTTLGEWKRHAPRFANSHFIALDASQAPSTDAAMTGSGLIGARQVMPPGTGRHGDCSAEEQTSLSQGGTSDALNDSTPILVLVEADEGVHLALESDAAFTALPHPLAQKPIPENVQAALAQHGAAPGATTFDATEALARLHPILRHRVF